MSKRVFHLKIKGLDWKVHLQSQTAYKRKHGKDSEGITYPEDQEIWLNKRYFGPRVIRHELLHAYVSSTNTESSDLRIDQMEDMCCSIIGHHLDDITLQCSQILEFFKGI